VLWDLDFIQQDYLVEYLIFTYVNMYGSSKFYFYLHKYVYFIVIVQNRLDRLTPFKHRLNGVNAKRRVTDCLPFSV
jgi:uncharacterized protein YhbP (UPF0306 family)